MCTPSFYFKRVTKTFSLSNTSKLIFKWYDRINQMTLCNPIKNNTVVLNPSKLNQYSVSSFLSINQWFNQKCVICRNPVGRTCLPNPLLPTGNTKKRYYRSIFFTVHCNRIFLHHYFEKNNFQ